MEAPRTTGYLPPSMDDETRAAFAALGEVVAAGFARTDRHFELQQAQCVELRAEVRQLHDRMDSLESRISGLETGVTLLRDYVTREITAIRQELRELRLRSDQNDELRREIAQLAARVDRLERSQQD